VSDLLEKIVSAKEKIGDEAAITIANYLKLENFNEQKLKGSCPFGHSDSTPSFIWNKKDQCYTCFSCGRRYSILDMYTEIEGSYFNGLKRLFKETGIQLDNSLTKVTKKDYLENYHFPHEEKDDDMSKVLSYLNKRGISENTIRNAGLRQDEWGNICFESHDVDGTLLCCKYRKSSKVKKGEPKMWYQKNASCCPILYNIDKVDVTKPLVIVEGEIDTLSCIEAGFTNVVSIPHGASDTSWIEFNYDFLENFNDIILWFDNDSAGSNGLNNTVKRIGEYRCKIVKPECADEDSVEKYFQQFNSDASIRKTDANNILLACGKERIIQLINTAEEIPVRNIMYLMDAKAKSIEEMEKFPTLIKGLDDMLYGNIFPCFTVYSGSAGSGKSSLTGISTVISALENNEKIFIFSGELSEGQLADWILSPLAGYNHIMEFRNEMYDRPFYRITDQAEARIRDYYRKNILLYTGEDSLETSSEDILSTMEIAYRKFGCRVFLIDNLMSISLEGVTTDGKWESQKKFIIKLANFATKYDANVNLVAHPRKPSGGNNQSSSGASIYDISGASEIGNLCHRMLWISRIKDDNLPNDIGKVKIESVKDRPTQSGGQYCEAFYDKKTRRIYTNNTEKYRTYKWEQDDSTKNLKSNYPKFVTDRLICNNTNDSETEPDCDQF
jgi:twinkle protein